MIRTAAVLFLLLSGLFSHNAALPVIGSESLQEQRNKLPDSAFKMDMKDAIVEKTEDYRARFVNVAKNPALTAADVQFNFVDLVIRPGKSFWRHTHPRSAEAVFVVKGLLKVTFWFEDQNPRVVSNVIRPSEYAVVPQGLPHLVTCVGQENCFFVVFFRSADPGIIPAPLESSESD